MAKHLIINGKVQGVYFRATAKELANELGINGWIKNTAEGNVEACIEGTAKAITQFVDWCHRGPDNAQVLHVRVNDLPDCGLQSFQILS